MGWRDVRSHPIARGERLAGTRLVRVFEAAGERRGGDGC